jgi:hypothetical protein
LRAEKINQAYAFQIGQNAQQLFPDKMGVHTISVTHPGQMGNVEDAGGATLGRQSVRSLNICAPTLRMLNEIKLSIS